MKLMFREVKVGRCGERSGHVKQRWLEGSSGAYASCTLRSQCRSAHACARTPRHAAASAVDRSAPRRTAVARGDPRQGDTRMVTRVKATHVKATHVKVPCTSL